MTLLDKITEKVLAQIDDTGFTQSGAFNLRHNGIAPSPVRKPRKNPNTPKCAAVFSPIPKISPKKTSPTPESQNATKTQTLKTYLRKSVKRYLNSRDFNTQARQAPPVQVNPALRNS